MRICVPLLAEGRGQLADKEVSMQRPVAASVELHPLPFLSSCALCLSNCGHVAGGGAGHLGSFEVTFQMTGSSLCSLPCLHTLILCKSGQKREDCSGKSETPLVCQVKVYSVCSCWYVIIFFVLTSIYYHLLI